MIVADFLLQVTASQLDYLCSSLGGTFTVLGAVQNVIFTSGLITNAVRDRVALE